MKDRSLLAGSLVAGMLASACCIGPLVLGVLGVSSLGFAAALAPLRPWFLGLTALLLALGFYLAYRPQRARACAPGQACEKPSGRKKQRIVLWLVTTVAVALATYPGWGARLSAAHASVSTPQPEITVVVIDIEGMSCTACAGGIQRELLRVPGAVRAEVSFEERRAKITLSAAHPRVEPLIAAIEKAGYRGKVVAQ